MHRTLAALVAAFFMSNASTLEVQGNTIVLTPEEIDGCATEGGCALVTRKQLFEAMRAVAERAASDALISCRNRT